MLITDQHPEDGYYMIFTKSECKAIQRFLEDELFDEYKDTVLTSNFRLYVYAGQESSYSRMMWYSKEVAEKAIKIINQRNKFIEEFSTQSSTEASRIGRIYYLRSEKVSQSDEDNSGTWQLFDIID